MNVTLYLPNQQPIAKSAEGFTTPGTNRFAQVPTQAAELLSCAPELVDVLASAPNYVVYTVFDSEDLANPEATHAVIELAQNISDVINGDELLRGPVVIVKA
ncbi:hypothetical protein E4631_23905 [Hymenobacter sp. UV11]|uniref:hypothetical protein n=1 Tax=Hymenobacter sp. UV11 TaxID=1849735 RepID=UPI00105D8EB4|nr:hypothetical protein [Hymenobacter sp. UV11]TFZ62975.1 hypothetical protein E4631_23905 [Hymenobacter sp. UV11]